VQVGFVTGEYPPMQGGVGAFTREVARAMADAGHEVHVFTRAECKDSSEPGINVEGGVEGRWRWRTLRQVDDWIKQIQASDIKLDAINIQFQTAAYDMHPAIHWLPSRIKDIPVVVTFHDLRVPYLFPKAGSLRESVVKKIARDADAVIATDRADESTLRDRWAIPEVCWIPIGSNVTAALPAGFDREQQRAGIGVGPDDLLISYFGFLNESKGGLVLVEALARLVEQGIPAHLVMIGGRAGSSDPTNLRYGERFDALVDQHSLENRIHWTGFVDDEGVSAHFYASDLTALPYLDGVSLRRGTLMAALAHGRAIITTQPHTRAPELDGVVETVEANDPDGLAEAIVRVWRDAERRRTLEQAAAQAAQHFTWTRIAERTIEFFESIQHGRKQGQR
jgi:glycosyltransferase involved in cell wall biosynthesis